MSDNIAVSIICNVYNQEIYVRDALEGFVMQRTNFAFEVLVHDDASTDCTADIVREYEQKYPELIKPIYQKENQYSKRDGTIKRLQAARAKGKYIAFCEGDDYWTDPLKLQKQYDFMEQNSDYTLCGCSTVWLNMLSGKVKNLSTTINDRDVTLEEFLSPKNRRPFPTVSFLMKAEIWKDRPDWGFPVGDLPMTYYAAMNGKVRMLADNMCVYRWNAIGSWTKKNDDDVIRANTCAKMIVALENMNRDTDYKYDELIQRKIIAQKYMKALMDHDFDAILSEELINVYNKKTFIRRLSDRMHCKYPNLHRKVRWIMGRAENR